MKPDNPATLKFSAVRGSIFRGDGKKTAIGLQEITDFGSNPGALRAWCHVPPELPAGSPLVVVLHGCTQNAAEYDTGAGWSQLADEQGFAVLLPEQRRRNNANLCFNWFSPTDSRRGSGEALSIRQMIAAMADAYAIDATRVFVTGLSAGGAMTSIMLATYPEVFAGGAVIAGLPFGAAASVGDAFARMAGQGYPDDDKLASFVRDASPHDGPWPRISVWHGSADGTVSPSNAERIIGQWRDLHGVEIPFSEQDESGGRIRRSWLNHAGEVMLEQNIIPGMGHGTPIKSYGADGYGRPGPHMPEVGISSTRDIAQFWDLVGPAETRELPVSAPLEAMAVPPASGRAARMTPTRTLQKNVSAIIEDALRAAGLMN